ncbi:SDR family oxidoreductase [Selenomonas sp. TAMA-11512]|uniref:SDR family NAD(P)-dependent oxidoreductase n=1 Tax=Selenomonas sp. TAMA-11512 TaxID=3095337 RepID=UPI00308C28B6|nr:SDR family oxidoreductase [Selenomonas sp. TAMA-11512]
MKKSIKNRVVLITGGTSGIGLAAADCFLKEGNTVILIGRSKDMGNKATLALNMGSHYMQADVRSRNSCISIINKVIERFSKLDVLVNAAGVYHEGALEEVSESDYDQIMSTNVKGTIFMCQAALPFLKESRGNIINVSSDAGVHGNYFCSLYSASKGAVNLFTRSLALEAASFGVRVNAVCPGDILTPMTEFQLQAQGNREQALREMESVYPLQRIGRPEEVADVISFLASDKAAFITGACWTVDGGLTA